MTRDRGQLLLIGAIVIAVVIVASVVLLNTVHSSPEITADTDARSLSDVENTNSELQNELEELFLGTDVTFGERSVYARTDTLEENTESFVEQYNDRLASDTAFVASVEYDDGEQVPGSVAWNTDVETGHESFEETIFEDVTFEEISDDFPFPQIHLHVDGLEDLNPTEEVGYVALGFVEFGEDNEPENVARLRIDKEEVRLEDDQAATTGDTLYCEFEEDVNEVTLDIRYGEFSITADGDEDPCEVPPDDMEYGDFEDLNAISDVQELEEIHIAYEDDENVLDALSYKIVTRNDVVDPGQCGDDPEQCDREDIELNPTFDIALQDPSVTYESTFTVYEEGNG